MRTTRIILGFIVLAVLFTPVVAVFVVPMSTADVNEAWQLNLLIDKIVVAGETYNPADLVGQIEFDPDGRCDVVPTGLTSYLVGAQPTVHAGVSSSLSPTTQQPQPILGYDMYRYAFGLDITTVAKKAWSNALFYESEEVIVSVYFTVWLSKGMFEDATAARITDVTVQDADAGILRQPTWDSSQISADYQTSLDPAKNVNPTFVPVSQANEQLIDHLSSDFTTADCHLSAKVRAGGVIEWSYNWIFPVAQEVQPDDVFVSYDGLVDVAVAQGSAPPIVSPFDFFIIILRSLGIIASAAPVDWTIIMILVIVVLVVVALIAFFVIKLMFGGKGGG